MGLVKTREEENLVMHESSPKAPIKVDASPGLQLKEAMEIQIHNDKIDETMEIQVQVQQVKVMKVLPLEEKNLHISSIIALAN